MLIYEIYELQPPSTEYVAPVIYDDSSPSKNAITLAHSSATPCLPSGTVVDSAFVLVSSFDAAAVIGVTM
jgi:hypothetical protein